MHNTLSHGSKTCVPGGTYDMWYDLMLYNAQAWVKCVPGEIATSVESYFDKQDALERAVSGTAVITYVPSCDGFLL